MPTPGPGPDFNPGAASPSQSSALVSPADDVASTSTQTPSSSWSSRIGGESQRKAVNVVNNSLGERR